jgi:hypothetical protein
MRTDLLEAVLSCSIDDLSLLDDAGADMFKIVEYMRKEGMEITLHSIMSEVFKEGIRRLGESVREFRRKLEKQEKSGEMAEIGHKQLKELRVHCINPVEDFGFYLNFQDTHLYVTTDKKKVYEEMFEQELLALEEYTGFNIE